MFHFSLTGSSTALTGLEKPQTGIIALRQPSFLGGLAWRPKGFFCLFVFLSILPSLETLVFVEKTAVLSYFGVSYNTRCELEPDHYSSYWSCGSSQARLVVLDADTPAKQCSIAAIALLEK